MFIVIQIISSHISYIRFNLYTGKTRLFIPEYIYNVKIYNLTKYTRTLNLEQTAS